MKVILDTCVLKLATLPNPDNPAALIVALWDRDFFECWASPAILEEYADVLADHPELLALIQSRIATCYPLFQLDWVRHEPDNRFAECALAVGADYLVTVNTARGHFDMPTLGSARILTPGAFLKQPQVRRFIAKL